MLKYNLAFSAFHTDIRLHKQSSQWYVRSPHQMLCRRDAPAVRVSSDQIIREVVASGSWHTQNLVPTCCLKTSCPPVLWFPSENRTWNGYNVIKVLEEKKYPLRSNRHKLLSSSCWNLVKKRQIRPLNSPIWNRVEWSFTRASKRDQRS